MIRREAASHDKTLCVLIYSAVVLSVGHHVDHIIRGNHVGWPLSSEVNAFTYSLAIYPLIVVGLLLYRSRRVGPGFWLFLSGGGALFLSAIHFGPLAVEPPSEIIDPYGSRFLGWLAFAWLVAFVAVLVISSVYEATLWARGRK